MKLPSLIRYTVALALTIVSVPLRHAFGQDGGGSGTDVLLSVSYTLSKSRAPFRDVGGFDPLAVAWASGAQPTHQINVGTNYQLRRFSLDARILLTSGTPYTPVVSADVNVDGMGGDRAFVFDPSGTPDTVLAREMSTLLATANANVRRCLRDQFGRVAAYNSCRTGWQLQVQPNLNFNFGLPTPSRSIASFNDRVKFSV